MKKGWVSFVTILIMFLAVPVLRAQTIETAGNKLEPFSLKPGENFPDKFSKECNPDQLSAAAFAAGIYTPQAFRHIEAGKVIFEADPEACKLPADKETKEATELIRAAGRLDALLTKQTAATAEAQRQANIAEAGRQEKERELAAANSVATGNLVRALNAEHKLVQAMKNVTILTWTVIGLVTLLGLAIVLVVIYATHRQEAESPKKVRELENEIQGLRDQLAVAQQKAATSTEAQGAIRTLNEQIEKLNTELMYERSKPGAELEKLTKSADGKDIRLTLFGRDENDGSLLYRCTFEGCGAARVKLRVKIDPKNPDLPLDHNITRHGLTHSFESTTASAIPIGRRELEPLPELVRN